MATTSKEGSRRVNQSRILSIKNVKINKQILKTKLKFETIFMNLKDKKVATNDLKKIKQYEFLKNLQEFQIFVLKEIKKKKRNFFPSYEKILFCQI